MTRLFKSMVLVILLSGLVPVDASNSVAISVTPSIAVQHGTAKARVSIERDVRNRTLIWEVEGTRFFSSSQMDLHGTDSPRSYFFVLRNLPEGVLQLRATVHRNDDSVITTRTDLKIVGLK